MSRRCLLLAGSTALSRELAAALAGQPPIELELAGPGGDPAGAAHEAWIYLAGDRGQPGVPDLDDAARVFGRWEAAAGALLVVASSAAHEPNSHHPGPVEEGRPPSVRAANPVARAWQQLEAEVAELTARHRGRPVALVRAAPSPVPGGRDPWSRLFCGRLAWTLPGRDPPVQIVAPGELAAAIAAAIATRARGVLHVAPSRPASLRRALRLAGVRPLPVPRWLQLPLWAARHRLGRGPSPSWLEYRRYATTIRDRRRPRSGLTEGHDTEAAAAELARRRRRRPLPPGRGSSDDWGRDRAAIDRWGRTGFRFLHEVYWRVEAAGLDAVPRAGAAVLVGVHRGFMPFDAIMALHLLATRTGRYPRYLIHPGLLKFAFFHDFFLRLGGVIACRENAEELLARGEMIAILPEGVRGAFALYRDAYRLDGFRRRDYVRLALAHGAPIVPYVTVGPAESMPLIAAISSRRWRRYSEWPCLPVPATLLPVPLPTKWHTRILEPLRPAELHPPGSERDADLVDTVHAEVRDRLRRAMLAMRDRRPSVFYGSVFGDGAD